MHSTIDQAMHVANQAQAWRVILTHMSQRFNKRDSVMVELP